MRRRGTGCLRHRTGLAIGGCLVGLSAAFGEPDVTSVERMTGDRLRLRTEAVPEGFTHTLESATSAAGPWWPELSAAGRETQGAHEFEAAADAWGNAAFYRVRQDPVGPWIRWLSPTAGIAGDRFTILGANFSPVPAENVIRFETADRVLTADVANASATVLEATVPVGVDASPGTNYLISVEVGDRQSLGVRFRNWTWNDSIVSVIGWAWLLLPPGTGKEYVVVGGGVPPYHVGALDAWEQERLSAVFHGAVLELTGTNGSGNVEFEISDSSIPPLTETYTVYLRDPRLEVETHLMFHTLLAGSSPGLNLHNVIYAGDVMLEDVALRFDNLEVDFSHLGVMRPLGVITVGRLETIYDRQLLLITAVEDHQLQFEVRAEDEDGFPLVPATGTLTRNPPMVRLRFHHLYPESLAGGSVDSWLVFDDRVFRLPESMGEPVTVEATYRSVTVVTGESVPMTCSTSLVVYTTGPVAPAPRIQRLLPVHGEIGRIVEVHGTGFAPTPAGNQVTFAGRGGSRLPAEVDAVEPGFLRVVVPGDAVSGPVQVNVTGVDSNPFHFMVRFRPHASIGFPSFSADVPVGPVLTFHQPNPSIETNEAMDEVDALYWTTTLDAGSMEVAALTPDQIVGELEVVDPDYGSRGEYQMRYVGQEATGDQRHQFDIRLQPHRTNALSHVFLWEPVGASGVAIEVRQRVKVAMGRQWTITFTEPVYRPPAAAGARVHMRTEVVSDEWLPLPSSEMRVGRIGEMETQ